MDACCATHPSQRPGFPEIAATLEQLLRSYEQPRPEAKLTSPFSRTSPL